MNDDILKGVMYERGTAVYNGERKYLTLIAMVVATDESLVTKHDQQVVVMGVCNLTPEIKKLIKYEAPYKLGDITEAIIHVSNMSPEQLTEL